MYTLLRKSLLLSALSALLSFGAVAQSHHDSLYPTPQSIHWSDRLLPIHQLCPVLQGKAWADSTAYALLEPYVMAHQIKSRPFTILIGEKGDRQMKRYATLAPKQAEGYYLRLDRRGAVVVGSDPTGTYYGVQTLLTLLQRDSIYGVEITDYPDVYDRGIVEGYYGKPWSYDDRLSVFDFMGKVKLNVYIYAPKDDPYHSSPNWRKPYPAEEALRLESQIKAAQAHKVHFVWAIHPGKDIRWNDSDRQALLDKFESMYAMGVRAFAVFFDDISGEGTKATKQAELMNYLDTHFVQAKGDVEPLIICPTEYNKSWANPKGGYLKTLGEMLHPSIRIMWTGNRVIADIDRPTMMWINHEIGRRAYIWWNYPVTDYVRDHLLLGEVYGNGRDIAPLVSGFVSNPMEHAEASKIALFSVADYLWNMKGYDQHASWLAATKFLMPKDYPYLRLFAENNSDLGPNGHGYRRQESVAFKPLGERWLSALHTPMTCPATLTDSVSRYYQQVQQSADRLLSSTDEPRLIADIRPWVRLFGYVGQFGVSVSRLQTALASRDTTCFLSAYYRSRALLVDMYELDIHNNQNPYQPGVKAGSKILLPTAKRAFVALVKAYNQQYGTTLGTVTDYNPFKVISTQKDLQMLPVRVHKHTVSISPKLEYLTLSPDDYVGIALDRPYHLSQVALSLGKEGLADQLRLYVGNSLQTAIPLTLTYDAKAKLYKIAKPHADLIARYIYLRPTSGAEVELKLEKFALRIDQ